MSRKILSFSLASILTALGLASCANEQQMKKEKLTMAKANILSLAELYRRDKQSFEDDYNSGNFLQMTDGTVMFFKSPTRLELIKVMIESARLPDIEQSLTENQKKAYPYLSQSLGSTNTYGFWTPFKKNSYQKWADIDYPVPISLFRMNYFRI